MFGNKRASDQFESNMAPAEIAPDTGGTKINLSMLIDFLLQKTYHELTVLSELWVFYLSQLLTFSILIYQVKIERKQDVAGLGFAGNRMFYGWKLYLSLYPVIIYKVWVFQH